ncbi:MAG: hypothetical protein KDI48_01670 [Xanthomonadales bacterium]|nr:hypothetical protein [Xanthomonadales bacterium]
MQHQCSSADLRYLAAFESCDIDGAAFRHREHLRVAYVLISRYGVGDAFRHLKAGLLRLLKHLGAGPDKYHETMTGAWLLAVDHFMHRADHTSSFDAFIERNGRLLDASIMHTHYRRETLYSAQAREAFVEPDLDPIPRYG